MALPNAPEVKLAIVGVSRDCFPIDLTRTRLGKGQFDRFLQGRTELGVWEHGE